MTRGRPERPYDFYERQRQKHEEQMRVAEEARQRQTQTQDRQGPDGNPLRGPWGGIY